MFELFNKIKSELKAPLLRRGVGVRFLDLCLCALVAGFLFLSPKTFAQPDTVIYNGNTEGCIAGNCENGYGIFVSANYRYEGNFINAKANGKGTLMYKDGKRYVGEFLNSEKHGKGIYYFADSSRYEGDFKNDKLEGNGTYIYKSGNKYTGEFENGLKSGTGTFSFSNGSIYTGSFVKDRIEGTGLWQYNNGDSYYGGFVKNKKHGKGIYRYADSSRYEGDFVNDLYEGRGIFYFKDGSQYVGEFKNDFFNGKGVCYYINNDIYRGEFKDGLYNGKGIYAYASGDYYEGEFTINVFNGKGVYVSENGTRTESVYENGRVVGDSKVTEPPSIVSAIPDIQLNKGNKTNDEKVAENENASTSVTKVKCQQCNGKGKFFQPEVKRNRSIVKDISNGIGPRNFVTYQVTEVVKPATYATCHVCGGTGMQ